MQYIAFFRGLNVGGKHKVKMADLRQFFLDYGFTDVKTYIQSGNVLFQSSRDAQSLPGLIAGAFTERFSFQAPVVVLSGDALSAIVAALPFTKDEIARAEAANPDVAHVYYYLSNSEIDPAAVDALQQAYAGPDRILAGKRALYLLCHQGIRDSKLAASLPKLDASFTLRNRKTMQNVLAFFEPVSTQSP